MRNLVNEQTEIGLLLVLPVIMAVIVFAPWMIKLFYTSEFTDAVILLQIFSLGCLGRVISWPMGFIILALGRAKVFAATETLTNTVHMVLIIVGLKFLGLVGVALAFAGLYVFYVGFMLILSNKLIGFCWSRPVVRLLAGVLPVVALGFALSISLPLFASTIIGGVAVCVVGLICLRGLVCRLGPENHVCQMLARLPLFRHLA
jgi:PST family polysaccharide transporter